MALDTRKEILKNSNYKNAGFKEPVIELSLDKVFVNAFKFHSIALNDFAVSRVSMIKESQDKFTKDP